MKKTIMILLVGLMAVPLFAQKVKISKRTAFIDNVAFLKWEGNYNIFQICPIKTMDGDMPIMTMQLHKHGEKTYAHIKFTDFDGELWITTSRKKFFRNLYGSKVIGEDGTVNPEKAKRFIRTYDEEIPVFIKNL